jgi:hypothetical protein
MPASKIWETLGIAATKDQMMIRRAYATRLKVTNPEDDATGFQQLRAAYEGAMALAKRAQLEVVIADAQGELSPRRPDGPQPGDNVMQPQHAMPAPANARAGAPQAEPTFAPPPPRPGVPGHDDTQTPPPPRTDPPSPSDGQTPPFARTDVPGRNEAHAPLQRRAIPSPAAPSEAQLAFDAEVAAAREVLNALHAALLPAAIADEVQLRQLLSRAIEVSGQGSLSVQQAAENTIAHMLIATAPKSDVLVEECIARFDWEKHENDLTPNKLVMAILARRRDIKARADLETRDDSLGKAYRRMTHPVNPVLRWVRANFIEARRWPEVTLLHMLKDKYPALLQKLDATQVAWWERFLSQPQFSYGLVRVGGMLALLSMFISAVSLISGGEARSKLALTMVLDVAGFAALLAGKLYLIDWPTFLIRRRWAGRAPLPVLAGWFPMLLVLSAVAVFLPDTPALWWSIAILGTTGCVWAIYASGPMPSVIQNRQFLLANSHIAMAVIVNCAVGSWWFISLPEFPSPRAPSTSFDISSVGVVALMCGAGFGVRALATVWTDRLTTVQRNRCTRVLIASAGPLAFAVWMNAEPVRSRPFLAWLVVAFVVIHRIACVGMSSNQIRIRAILLVTAGVVATMVIGGEVIPMSAPVIQLGTIILMAAALVNLFMSVRNQKQRG